MKKEEKLACANWEIMKGLAVVLFGLIWNYFTNMYLDVWTALPSTLAVMGLLLALYGLYRRSSM